jgi:hypothetical protein
MPVVPAPLDGEHEPTGLTASRPFRGLPRYVWIAVGAAAGGSLATVIWLLAR